MIKRAFSEKILSYAKQYPVVTITGPRQSGKTTLCQMLFPDKEYFSLEDLDIRNEARSDPRNFLENCVKKGGAILDEIQRVPELLSYIQTIVDREKKEGLFILTGSQHFGLIQFVAQTLAGRTALATLLPFSYEEVAPSVKRSLSISDWLYTGFYPRIYDKKLNPTEALSFYVNTYVERDIRSLINIKDLSKFEQFLKLCASRTGQILNVASLGNDCGINHNTAKSWLTVLEASYILQFVRPHHKNFKKRLIKSPKLYFIDTGLAAYLLDIENSSHIENHPLKGALFETFVVSEILKFRYHHGKKSNLYYFRDNIGHEVDLILDYGTTVLPIEIKLGQTLNNDFFKGLNYYKKLNPQNSLKSHLIYGGERNTSFQNNECVSYKNIASIKHL